MDDNADVYQNGGFTRVQIRVPQESTAAPAVGGPGVPHDAGRNLSVNAAGGDVRSRSTARYQSGGEVDESQGIIATARTRVGGAPAARLTESCIVRVNGMDTTIGAAIRAGVLPRSALDGGGNSGAPAAPAPAPTVAPAEDPEIAADRAAVDRINELPSPIVQKIIGKITSDEGLGEGDFAAIERVGMTRAEFLGHAERAVRGFARQGRAVLGEMGVDADALSDWAQVNAKAEWWAAIRENITQGTDLRFAALAGRFMQSASK